MAADPFGGVNETTALLVNDDIVSPNYPRDDIIKKQSTSIIDYFNVEDYWTIILGFFFYFIIVVTTHFDWTVAHIFPWSHRKDLVSTVTPVNIAGIGLIIASIIAALHVNHRCLDYTKKKARSDGLIRYGFIGVLVLIAKFIGANKKLHDVGVGDAVWAIVFGCILRTLLSAISGDEYAKSWLTDLFNFEFFIKVSIVLLAVNFRSVASVGARGLAVAWGDTLFVLVTMFALGYLVFRLEYAQLIITTVGLAICGSSAVMTVIDCIKTPANDYKELASTYIAFMSLFNIPLIPGLPIFAAFRNFTDDITGAWIGGSVDSTGSVMASASLADLPTLHAAIIVKMMQNILIAPIALVITLAWTRQLKAKILWDKFPKFVLGFLVVSAITTALPQELGENVVLNSFVISEWFSGMSFVLIGFDIDLITIWAKLYQYKGLISFYIVGQTFDVLSTLGCAYAVFKWI